MAPGRSPVSVCGRLLPSTQGAEGRRALPHRKDGAVVIAVIPKSGSFQKRWPVAAAESTASLCHSRGHGQHLWEVSCGSRGTGHGERRDRVPPGSGTVCLEDSGLAKDAALAQATPLCITDWLESKPGVSRCLQEVAW